MAGTGVAFAIGGAGVVLLWSAVENQKITVTLQDIIKGQKPAAGPNPTDTGTADSSTALNAQGQNAAQAGTDPNAEPTPSANQSLAKLLAASYGWSTGPNWNALVALWTRESGWSQYATNPSSGAYGIPQALPPTKMPGSAQAAGGSSPMAQIIWGLDYILGRYGSPVAAMAHEDSVGWY